MPTYTLNTAFAVVYFVAASTAGLLYPSWYTAGIAVTSVVTLLMVALVRSAVGPRRRDLVAFTAIGWAYLCLTLTPLFEPIAESLLTTQLAFEIAIRHIKGHATRYFIIMRFCRALYALTMTRTAFSRRLLRQHGGMPRS